MTERIASALKRKSLTKPSRWAEAYRMMGRPYPGKWTFKYHPWLREMHDSKAVINIGQKCAQVGYTETVLNLTFFKIDVERVDCLYVLPAKTPDASDFSAARFDPALELSEHLTKLFSDVKNIGHKRAGTTNLYIRGSRSRGGLKSIPVGFIVLDELDEMEQDNIPLATERASGQPEKQIWMISTPTIPNFGINREFEESTKEYSFFKCPHCNRFVDLTFPESIVITAEDIVDPRIRDTHLICKQCKNKLNHEEKHIFLADCRSVAEFPQREKRGFHVSQLYSSTVTPVDLAMSWMKAQQDPADEQEFYNSKLGVTHIVDGAKVNDTQIHECIGNHVKYENNRNGLVTMGVDVGRWLHVEIDKWDVPNQNAPDMNIVSIPTLIWHGKVGSFEELDLLMMNYYVSFCVIDANPEGRKAFEFACRFWGRVKKCFYARGVRGKNLVEAKEAEASINVDRTSWLDISLGRFRRGKDGIILPKDINSEYKDNIKALVRIYEKDDDGQPIGRYVRGNDPDHYAHARNYAEIALPFALGLGVATNIHGVL